MLLVAQRVVSREGLQGINAYRYQHGPEPWPADPTPLLEPRTAALERQSIQVHPGGNEILSFLDVAAPSGVSEGELIRIARKVAERPAPDEIPLIAVLERCAFRLHMKPKLLPIWRDEFKELMGRLVLL